MKLLMTLILTTVAFSTTAKADVTGTWKGSLIITTSEGDVETADDFELTITRKDNKLSFSDPSGWTYFDGFTFDIHGTDLMLNHNKVGSVSNNRLEITLTDDIDQEIDHTVMTMNDDGTIDYADHDLYYDGSYADFYGTMSSSAQGGKKHVGTRRGDQVRKSPAQNHKKK